MVAPAWHSIDLKRMKTENRKPTEETKERRVRRGRTGIDDRRDSEGRLVNTRSYAIAWGVLNKPYSRSELYRKCKDDPDAPSFSFIVNTCWEGYPCYYRALVKAGMEPRPPRNDSERRRLLAKAENDGFRKGLLDKDYDAVRMAAHYGVTTKEAYNRLRRENADARALLPASNTIAKWFGSWRRFRYEVMKLNADATLTEYVRLSAECGHWLRMRECDSHGIPIRGIMDLLRPSLFNALCYRKLELLGLSRSIPRPADGNEK